MSYEKKIAAFLRGNGLRLTPGNDEWSERSPHETCIRELANYIRPEVLTREKFVDIVLDVMESAPESLRREMGEALVGMGVATLGHLGIGHEDIARSIVDRRNVE